MANDEEAQSDEILAMESILDQDTFQIQHRGDLVTGLVKVDLDIPDPFYLAEDCTDDDNLTKTKIKHLPPLLLHFTMPKDYPSESKPIFTLSSNWLHRLCLSLLCHKLDRLWNDNKGMGILFTWTNYLQTNSLRDLGIDDVYVPDWYQNPSKFSWNGVKTPVKRTENEVVAESGKNPGKKFLMDGRAASDPIPLVTGEKSQLVTFLLTYNQEKIRDSFNLGNHTCESCFTIKSGTHCVLFLCGHAFCKDCTGEFYKTIITEGSVENVTCLAVDCNTRPGQEVVKDLVGQELFERYDQLLLKRCLENMQDVTYCPRKKCGKPVICEQDWNNFSRCSWCDHTFCGHCKKAYHGVEPCRLIGDKMKEVYKKYMEGNADEKNALVKTYGKKQVQQLVDTVRNEEWIQRESKPCTKCRVPIEKFDGCNKVTCIQCTTVFCWLCLKQLDKGNPYAHFNDPNSSCFNNLFPPMEEAEDGDEQMMNAIQIVVEQVLREHFQMFNIAE